MTYKNPEDKKRRDREYYLENRDAYKKKQHARYTRQRAERREKYINYKKTLKCELCGEDRWPAIQFHHRDPTKKTALVSDLSIMYKWERVMEEINKCQPICANCHLCLHHPGYKEN